MMFNAPVIVVVLKMLKKEGTPRAAKQINLFANLMSLAN